MHSDDTDAITIGLKLPLGMLSYEKNKYVLTLLRVRSGSLIESNLAAIKSLNDYIISEI